MTREEHFGNLFDDTQSYVRELCSTAGCETPFASEGWRDQDEWDEAGSHASLDHGLKAVTL